MAEILDFHDSTRAGSARTAVAQARHDRREADGDSYSFWPEVECGLWHHDRTATPDPSNSAGRVLGEMAVILGAAALLVLLVTVFIGGPP
jgi:hypothetical protein